MTVEYSIQVENRLWAVVEGPVKVVVAEDSYLVREALSGLLSADPRVRVEGMATDYESTLGLVDDLCPDVVVTDVRMPPSQTDEGIRLAAALRASHPRTGVVVLSQYAEPAYAIALVEAGSHGRGYLLKERIADLDQLVSAIHVVAAGGSMLDPVMIDALVAAQNTTPGPVSRLTPREREVLCEDRVGQQQPRGGRQTGAVPPSGRKAHQRDLRQIRSRRRPQPGSPGQRCPVVSGGASGRWAAVRQRSLA